MHRSPTRWDLSATHPHGMLHHATNGTAMFLDDLPGTDAQRQPPPQPLRRGTRRRARRFVRSRVRALVDWLVHRGR